LTRDGAVW